jgi:hypothetical protein
MKGHLRNISILENNKRKGRDSALVQKVFLCLSFSESVFIITNLTIEPKYLYHFESVPPVRDPYVCLYRVAACFLCLTFFVELTCRIHAKLLGFLIVLLFKP